MTDNEKAFIDELFEATFKAERDLSASDREDPERRYLAGKYEALSHLICVLGLDDEYEEYYGKMMGRR